MGRLRSDRDTDWFALVTKLEAEGEAARAERDIANQYAQQILQNREAELSQLRRTVTDLRCTVELQTKATLAFRKDFLEWRAKAIALEARLEELSRPETEDAP